ncbi:hypothetical protein VZQ01_24685 [Myxococcus faecalis]|jgi:hypothetical protein|uniref:hypothetical protein n=1 Tax=Myxococcus TaxID=32 RepID=UPI001CC14B04|nr:MULTISPECIES: hypothetical protein [unclassified Myxococcus]MBZ4396329.1 hypothetical protein [Myxococcus sp. AS-1-15]MBZ4413044.1 hypothetical protein [Myxococcus sp. XM-1-1-1]BDT37839.1 hypothetical protein MFMH1_75080 [Myxococcus sp. MH1]
MSTPNRSSLVHLSLQRALLGAIPSRLRAVTVRFDDTRLHFEAFFDGAIRDEDRETMSEVETELIADFPDDHEISHELIRLDPPALIPKDRAWVYYRQES